MAQYIELDAVVAEIEKRINFNKTLNSHSRLDECKAILSFIDTLEVKDPYEQCVQYPSVKDGIQAHAETYSFNIKSLLFNQLTKEQQKLWRKEIEQAFVIGGEVGIELARDSRYKENLEAKEGQEEPVSNPTPNEKMSVERWKEACKAACCVRNYRSHCGLTETSDDYFVDGVQWADEHPKEEPVSKDMEEAAVEAFKHIVDSDKNSFLEIFKAGAEWKEEQMMKDAIDAKIGSFVDGTVYDVDFNIDSDLKQDDKIKVIIIKSE